MGQTVHYSIVQISFWATVSKCYQIDTLISTLKQPPSHAIFTKFHIVHLLLFYYTYALTRDKKLTLLSFGNQNVCEIHSFLNVYAPVLFSQETP